MQSIRFLVFFLSCMLVFSILLYNSPTRALRTQDIRRSQSVGTYFNWRTPSSLFPPSAIISLTDDNSTFFLARPAAFGPDVPEKSLSGQLWIGSGFGDDHIGRSSPGGRPEGELGCSDVPGWHEIDGHRMIPDTASDSASPATTPSTSRHNNVKTARGAGARKPAHADIQSLQESAEIAGKIALLSRGGCGFLDKVEWAQRRGAVAVIVGDDIRGGALVTMFARGDTSNVTIPALFTSHTTAHLLSSLMPSGRQRMLPSKSATRLAFALGGATNRPKPDTLEASAALIEPGKFVNDKPEDRPQDKDQIDDNAEGSGWFWALFGTDDAANRQLSAEQLDNWVLQTGFEEHDSTTKGVSHSKSTHPKSRNKPTDGFVIGVHDWRDPDLVVPRKESLAKRTAKNPKSSSKQAKAANRGTAESSTTLSGQKDKAIASSKDTAKPMKLGKSTSNGKDKPQGWFNKFVNGQAKPATNRPDSQIIDPAQPISNPAHLHDIHMPGAAYDNPSEHDGLWVTLTPTSMSSSPFFDTLLVLVVSPLVTLTIVYALLLLRSRIRRRRWRAPKSVVERLPVRTYQTMAASSPVSSVSSSISTPASMHTPLLSSVARPIAHRPRSRTGADVLSSSSANMQSLDTVEEKREAGLAEWRRKYGGKQRECVVCLEEYVDGISRVMSLPCGHEFHEGCITPWLTTRRRTCPICKGDVVRSLARSAGSTSSAFMNHDLREEEDEDEVQEQALLRTNDDPSSQRPISRGSEEFEDLERGFVASVDRDR